MTPLGELNPDFRDLLLAFAAADHDQNAAVRSITQNMPTAPTR